MQWFNKNRFLTRILIVYFIHIIIKGFDQTFGEYLDFTFRGIIFSIFFISLWVIAWYVAEYINTIIAKRRQITRLLINAAFGFLIAFITNAAYMYGDIYIFNNSSIWENISLLNPELTFGLSMFYIIGYITHEYINNQLTLKEKQLTTEKLEKENVMAQYKSLKAQIEPHFLFNSLSVLSSIVHTDANLASDFIVKLSKTLRYIIQKNEFTLVPLKEELTVVEDYFYLLKTRFNKGVELLIEMDERLINTIYIPPASIQLLIENAVKHNKQSDEQPLQIEIKLDPNYITVQNNVNKINTNKESTSVGLQNIKQRYKLLSGKEVIIQEKEGYFMVKLPILNQNHYEDFNN
jgi:two-component system LytT family sensor kinase